MSAITETSPDHSQEEEKRDSVQVEESKKNQVQEDDSSKASSNKEVKEFEDPHETQPKLPISLIGHIGVEWIWQLLAMFFAACAGASGPAFYIIFQRLIDTVIPGEGELPPTNDELKDAIAGIALEMLYLAIGIATAEGLKEAFISFAQHRFEAKIKRLFFKSVLRQEMGYFDMKKSGVLLSHLSEDVSVVVEAWTAHLAKTTQFASQFIVGIVLSFRASWVQTLLMMATVPAFSIVGVAALFVLWASKLTSNASANALSTATEVVGGMKTVRSMSAEEKETKRFDAKLSKVVTASTIKSFATGSGMLFGNFLVWSVVAFAFFIGGILITDGINGHSISVGKMFEVFGASLFAVLGIALSASELAQLTKATASANQLLRVIDRPPQIKPRGGKRIPEEELKGKVVFENVSFAYPSRPDVVVLEDFSITINPGESVALVGESGSGKSTIVNLLEKFYVPTSGKIYVDGYDLMEIDPLWWRKTIGIVSQEPVLFGMSIKDNIKYGSIHGLASDKDVSEEQIITAAKMANAHDFIMELKDKYETSVGERGVGLSGGQKQRIAIARTCLTNPLIALFDEATSALDNQSETLVQEALDKLMEGRTSISIAHRLSTIMDCDKIVVMDHGNIVEIGNHSSLLKKEGAYYELAHKQMLFGQDEDQEL